MSRCFRWSRSAIQCGWWYVSYVPEFDRQYQCYGNSRATARADGLIYSRNISARCTNA